ncbi:MAG: class I SAM-dependent methyltransferase [Phycisphaerae bacterium]|nr:class I SAM-dependent methyltransferase [Phycisphaerae bacterium]
MTTSIAIERATLDRCPACRAPDARMRCQRTFRGRRWTLAQCRRCDLQFTSPVPSPDDLQSFYAGRYHAQLRSAGETDAAFGAKYLRYAATLRRHLPTGRVVDIGCSTGLLVRTLRDSGYEAEGIELNHESAAWGRAHYGAEIHTEALEHCFAPESLDAVLLTDVLEHTQHPRDFLRDVATRLVPGGFALITFPDIQSIESRYQQLLAQVFRRDWMWSSCHIPLHVWEFTRATAEACFAAAGFRVLELRRSQLPSEPAATLALAALACPLRLLQWAPLARCCGSQMEFVICKVAADGVRTNSEFSIESDRAVAHA